ncbi:MAG: class I SAM-dependent methyltransferase [Verrucomicrobiota bacterium]
MREPTQRFSQRVDDYAKYRPGYPSPAAAILREQCQLQPGAPIADIGSGTGIFSRQLLRKGFRVIGIEPNAEMREYGARSLRCFPLFQSWDGRSEETGLPDNTVEAITAAQAFHWFDVAKTRREFRRILKPGGWVYLIWNDRRIEGSAFQRSYECLLEEFGIDYHSVNHRGPSRNNFADFLGANQFESRIFPNFQICNWEQLRGRVLSCSYVPPPGDPDCLPMLRRLEQIYAQHQVNGEVRLEYDTRVFWGRIF